MSTYQSESPASVSHRLDRRGAIGIVALLCFFLLMGTWFITRNSATFDEPTYYYAGHAYLGRGDFSVNYELPPLSKEIAALPASLLSRLGLMAAPHFVTVAENPLAGPARFLLWRVRRAPRDDGASKARRAMLSLDLHPHCSQIFPPTTMTEAAGMRAIWTFACVYFVAILVHHDQGARVRRAWVHNPSRWAARRVGGLLSDVARPIQANRWWAAT